LQNIVRTTLRCGRLNTAALRDLLRSDRPGNPTDSNGHQCEQNSQPIPEAYHIGTRKKRKKTRIFFRPEG